MGSAKPSFESEFLDNYLKFGLGSMPKADVDALVMYLLDRHGYAGSPPLARLGNQIVSERLRTPVSKVRKLRYDAALKFGTARVEDEARGRLLAALALATLEPQDGKICLIIEDSLAKNWLQGQLKIHPQVFDHSFNSEIVRVSAQGLFTVLGSIFDRAELETFRTAYDTLQQTRCGPAGQAVQGDGPQLCRRRRENGRRGRGGRGQGPSTGLNFPLAGRALATPRRTGARSPASRAPTTAAGRYSCVGLGWMPMGGGGACKGGVASGLLAKLRSTGRPKAEVTKERITIRLSPDVLSAFRASGSGWC